MTITDEGILRLIVGIVGVLTALTQVLVSLTKIKDDTKSNWAGLTRMGWVFYGCTILLGALPSIQSLVQDGIDRRNRAENQKLADSSEARIKREYDKSLLVMKAEFDKSSSNLTEILANYGYKLDSANNSLTKITDSPRITITAPLDPILQLVPNDYKDKAIRIGDKLINGQTRVYMTFISVANSSSHFKLKHSFVLYRKDTFDYIVSSTQSPLDSSYIIPPNGTITASESIPLKAGFERLFYWVRGEYRSVDGSGKYTIDVVYSYEFSSGITFLMKGEVRKKIVDVVTLWE